MNNCLLLLEDAEFDETEPRHETFTEKCAEKWDTDKFFPLKSLTHEHLAIFFLGMGRYPVFTGLFTAPHLVLEFNGGDW